MIKHVPFLAGALVSISKDITVEVWGKLWLLVHWFSPSSKGPLALVQIILDVTGNKEKERGSNEK